MQPHTLLGEAHWAHVDSCAGVWIDRSLRGMVPTARRTNVDKVECFVEVERTLMSGTGDSLPGCRVIFFFSESS